MKRVVLGFLGLGLSFAFASVGCEAGSGDSEDGGGGDGAGNSTGTNNPNASTSDGFSTGTTTGVGGGCVGIDKTAEKVPLDMYIMLDQSGSMSDPPSMGGGTKWDAVEAALTAFVNQPEAAGIGVGIQYFPLESGANCTVLQCTMDADCGPGCGPCDVPIPNFGVCTGFGASDSCVVTDYATPDVEIAVLPGNATAIIQSMANHGPTGGTPTSAALEGAISHAQSWATANPGHAVIVVLATDGDPTSCDSDLAYINGVAAAGYNGMPSIPTFVIGVGGSVSALNGFAAAGGTGSAFMIDQDPNVQQAFLDALNQIQGLALPCSYLIPEPDMGEINYDQVNVEYTPGGGGTPETLPKVSGPADCPPGGNAWYYDNEQMPTQIVLCPDTCTNLSQDTMGQIQIVLGCDTVVQ